MNNPNTVVIGYGEIGKALYKYVKRFINVVHVVDTGLKMDEARMKQYDYMLVTMPCPIGTDGKPDTDYFDEQIKLYKNKYMPKCIFIFSTVPVGTCERLEVAHIPIEGRHPKLYRSIRNWKFMLGYDNDNDLFKYVEFLKLIRKEFCVVPSRTTEIAKLLSTLHYGINIEFARFTEELCEKYDIEYDHIKNYNINYNHLYSILNQSKYIKRYILDPPLKRIGGHCIVPNAVLLQHTDPNKYCEDILEVDSWFSG